MKRFILEQSETEFYTSHSGFALVGLCLNRYGHLTQALEKGMALRHGIAHADMIKSYMGTLCLGKSDFEAIENHRDDDYFKAALAIQGRKAERIAVPPYGGAGIADRLRPAADYCDIAGDSRSHSLIAEP